jgi:hypothetical protein
MTRLPALSGRPILISLENAIGIVGRDGLCLSQSLKVIQERLRHHRLGNKPIDNHSSANANAVEVLVHTESNEHEGTSSDLDDDDLKDEDAGDDEDEEIVIEEILEDIDFLLLQLSSVEEVKHLQEDKDVEEDTEMLATGVVPLPLLHRQTDRTSHSEDLVPLEQNYHQNEYLVN